MTIRRPHLGPAGRAELDEPIVPEGLAPADRAALAGDPRWPTAPPPTDPEDEHEIGDPAREDDRREEENGGFSKE